MYFHSKCYSLLCQICLNVLLSDQWFHSETAYSQVSYHYQSKLKSNLRNKLTNIRFARSACPKDDILQPNCANPMLYVEYRDQTRQDRIFIDSLAFTSTIVIIYRSTSNHYESCTYHHSINTFIYFYLRTHQKRTLVVPLVSDMAKEPLMIF